jgi:hypothetical protein
VKALGDLSAVVDTPEAMAEVGCEARISSEAAFEGLVKGI